MKSFLLRNIWIIRITWIVILIWGSSSLSYKSKFYVFELLAIFICIGVLSWIPWKTLEKHTKRFRICYSIALVIWTGLVGLGFYLLDPSNKFYSLGMITLCVGGIVFFPITWKLNAQSDEHSNETK